MSRCLFCYEHLDEGMDFHPVCSKAIFGNPTPPQLSYSLSEMAELAKEVVERSVAVPGVQPKLSLSLIEKKKEESKGRLTVVGALGGMYILKPPTKNYPQMPENEHVTMKMAEVFGIKTVPSSLIRLQSGELAYLTKRIDRTDSGMKIHMLDMFQITEAYDKYKGSMEKVGKAILEFSEAPLLDALIFFELTLFSFVTGNNDMHLKNFSLIQSEVGWKLSPAYDLLNVTILLPEDQEELALSMQGKKRKFRKQDFVKLGEELGLTQKQIERAFSRLEKNAPAGKNLLEKSFLSDDFRLSYMSVLKERFQRLGLNWR